MKLNGLKPDAKEVLQTLNCKTSLMEKRETVSLRLLMAGSGHGAAAALLATGPIAEEKAVTAETLKSYHISCSYDAASGRWSVRFDSGRDYGYSVIVEDKSGMAWLAGSDNG